MDLTTEEIGALSSVLEKILGDEPRPVVSPLGDFIRSAYNSQADFGRALEVSRSRVGQMLDEGHVVIDGVIYKKVREVPG